MPGEPIAAPIPEAVVARTKRFGHRDPATRHARRGNATTDQVARASAAGETAAGRGHAVRAHADGCTSLRKRRWGGIGTSWPRRTRAVCPSLLGTTGFGLTQCA